MSVRRKLMGSAATIALAGMATIGGSFAYFSSEANAASKFTNGTLVLAPNAPHLQHFTLDNFKPGDKLVAVTDNQEPAMVLNNQGTLPMNVFAKIDTSSVKGSTDAIWVDKLEFGEVDVLAKYPAIDANGDKHVTLTELGNFFKGDTTVNGNDVVGVGKYIGFLPAPKPGFDWNNPNQVPIKSVKYQFTFNDDGKDQNGLQGDVTNITFKFTGLQYEGKTIDSTKLTNDGKPGGGGDYTRTDDINDREGTKNDK
ncbi:hypothetical protein AM500_10700 [Bacillus sp. FJAT-18017]|uniref:TasA family protein n=1 Tax=Bacillus sp. FJAT-18017 TaxID=1705566 RepID=UPI0006AE34BF|nr:TasA family protein [Bacillus sp. FJAT-18017]ALC90200.1 hypothetical protein AM500_10700 [Bacillus sp. FJAT-18017]